MLLVAALLTVALASPPGDADYWTYVRKDAFKHYACKTKEKDGEYTVRTAAYDNGNNTEPGVYTAIARGSNKNVVTLRSVVRA